MGEKKRRGRVTWRLDPIGILRAMRHAKLTNVTELSRRTRAAGHSVSRTTLHKWLSNRLTYGWVDSVCSVAKVLGVGPSELTK